MRESGERASGRGRSWLIGSAALAALVIGGSNWPNAEATPTEVERLGALLRAPAGASRKAMAIEDLRKIDSSASRAELQALADSADERLAVLAIRALGREGGSASKEKVAGIVASSSRSVLVREAAVAVWCQMQADDEESYADGKDWAEEKTSGNSRLAAQLAASAARHWASEVADDE